MSKILAIDIGMGTSDIFLYDSSKNIENCIKFVVPTPSRRYLKELKKINFSGSEKIFISGDTIGGGPLARKLIALAEEKKAGIVMTQKAAYTVRNDPEEVAGFGIKIVSDHDFKSPVQEFDKIAFDRNDLYISFTEIEIPFLISFFENAGERMQDFDGICLCAQDHGICKSSVSDRKNRFIEFEKILKKQSPPTPYSFCFKNKEVPDVFYRLKCMESKINSYFPSFPSIVMDSSPAALLGCMEYVREYGELYGKKLKEPYLMVNLGNNHAIFVIIKKGEILAFYEHHSWVYDEDPQKLASHVERFCDGNLPSEEVFEDEGNGALYFDPPGFKKIKNIIVTGPNRNIFARTPLKVHYSAVGGDMMMSGPIGMAMAFKKLYDIK